MFMRLKDEMPDPAREVYHIDSITAYVNSANNRDTSRGLTYTTPEGYHIIDPDHFLRPHVFSRTLLVRPEQIYKDTDYTTSLSRLVSLGVFQFVKARFDPASTADTNSRLNLYYYLTPAQKKQLRFEVTALTRSDNTTGTELALNWRHRNLFRGAELFNIRLYSGIEGQSVGVNRTTRKNITSLTRRAGIDMSLTIPKILAPIKLNPSGKFVPQTKIEADYDTYRNNSLYTLTSSRVSFGYQFKNRITSENGITILGISYVRPTNITDSFQLAINKNRNLYYAIEPQFIIGPSWN
jgi:outer membrane protein assembly factor BamA